MRVPNYRDVAISKEIPHFRLGCPKVEVKIASVVSLPRNDGLRDKYTIIKNYERGVLKWKQKVLPNP